MKTKCVKKCVFFFFFFKFSYQNSVSHRVLEAKICLSLSHRLACAFESEYRVRLLSKALRCSVR